MDISERARDLEVAIEGELKGSMLAFAAPGLRAVLSQLGRVISEQAHEIEVLKHRMKEESQERGNLSATVAGILRGVKNGS